MKRKITGIPDGDTVKTKVKVQGSNYLRPVRFNTPEKGQKGFDLARQRFKQALPRNGVVNVKVVGRDTYGRPLVELRNGRRSVNKIMKNYGY
jgi:endonuclease YncB( thermonuclease family)